MRRALLFVLTMVLLAACGRVSYPADARPRDASVTDADAADADTADADAARPDSSCTPACDGRSCGTDGCGDVCGTCGAGERCAVDVCEVTVCEVDGDCLECERCSDNACLPLADGTDCTDGVCHGGVCCAGCFDGAACRTGDVIEACGVGGGSCATCAIPMRGTASCPSGTCEYECMADYADCNSDPADGCEVDLGSDIANCGACGNVCAGTCDASVCTVDPCRSAAGVGMPACRLLSIVQTSIGSNGFNRVWRGQDMSFPTSVVVTGVEFMHGVDAIDEIRLMTSSTALTTLAASTVINRYDESAFARWHQVSFATAVPLTASTEYTAWFHLASTPATTSGCNLLLEDASWGGHHTDADPDGQSAAATVDWNYQYGTNIRVYGYVP